MNLRALIVDDEAMGREALNNFLTEFCENIEVIAQADSVKTAVESIRKNQPDIVFLDIEMPQQNGFQLFDYFEKIPFEVIFVTAYDQYAIKAFNCSALDYLLKPVDLDDLRAAIQKVREKRNLLEHHRKYEVLKDNLKNSFKNLTLPTMEGYMFVKIEEIVRCESSANYTVFFLKDGSKTVVSRTLKEYDTLLSDFNFVRVHRSHLVNLSYIRSFLKGKKQHIVMSDGTQIAISPAKKDELLEKLSAL